MRIIGGQAAGRLLKVIKGYNVRPTPDLVRQAIFNSLGTRVEGARVLDLFSGSGALGLECVSRGAAWVLSIEKVPRHVAAIRGNLSATNLPDSRHDARTLDVFVALRQLAMEGQRFDLITADPPFGPKNVGVRSRSASQKLLDDDGLPGLLEMDGLLVLGHTRRDTLAIPPTWSERKVLKHGDSIVRILERAMVDFRSAPAAEE